MHPDAVELVASVVLDPEAAAETFAAVEGRLIETLAGVIKECKITMQQRGRRPNELQPFLATGDPVMALTVNERVALALALRLRLLEPELVQILGKRAGATIKTARRELARAGIAMALLTNSARCPVMEKHQSEGEVLNRARALILVSHAAECQRCVEVMRVVDKQILEDYTQAPRAAIAALDASADLAARPTDLDEGFLERLAGERNWLRYALVAGAASSVLLLIALVFIRN